MVCFEDLAQIEALDVWIVAEFVCIDGETVAVDEVATFAKAD